jgi:hypothetical protein
LSLAADKSRIWILFKFGKTSEEELKWSITSHLWLTMLEQAFGQQPVVNLHVNYYKEVQIRNVLPGTLTLEYGEPDRYDSLFIRTRGVSETFFERRTKKLVFF